MSCTLLCTVTKYVYVIISIIRGCCDFVIFIGYVCIYVRLYMCVCVCVHMYVCLNRVEITVRISAFPHPFCHFYLVLCDQRLLSTISDLMLCYLGHVKQWCLDVVTWPANIWLSNGSVLPYYTQAYILCCSFLAVTHVNSLCMLLMPFLTLQRAEMSTGYTWPSRSNLHLKFLTFGHSGPQGWAPECPNIRN